MNKADRKKVFDKYGGRCALCGDGLTSGWHVWDVLPIKTIVTDGGELLKINTEQENLIPACKECGSVRIKNESGKMDLESFRNEIVSMYRFCRDSAMYSSSLRRAIRYGLVEETNKAVVFYFETLTRPREGGEILNV